LFLNKDDLFKEKLKAGLSISHAFADYTGATEYQPSLLFIKDKFCDVVDPTTGKPKEIYTHVTCATDTMMVKMVFRSLKEFLLNAALRSAGLVNV